MPAKKLAILTATIAVAITAQGAEKVTFDDHVLPIFRNACLNCHNPDKKKAGLDLSTYQATLQGSENGKVLQSGNAAASLLFKCVKQTEDPKMPPKGDKLSDAELTVVEQWITGQLLENATGKAIAAASNNVSVAVVSLERPAGPPPMPGELPLEPVVRTRSANALTALAVSPWAPLVAIGGQKQVLLYNTETLAPLGVLPFPEGFPTIIRFSRNGQLLLTGGGLGGKSGKVVLWDIKTGERIATLGNEFDQVLAADLSADQQFVALGGPNRILKIYATKDGKLLHSVKKHTDWITAIAFSPDGKYLASADRSGGVQVWEGATGKEFNTLAGHKAMVTGLAFMPGVLASSSEDGKVVLWDAKEGKEIRNWAAHPGGAEWVDFTPDGRVVSCGRDKVAKAWDQNGKLLGTVGPMNDIALRAALSNDRVIVGDWTGQIRVATLDGKALGELTSNPPSLAERLADSSKRLTDSQAAVPTLQQQLAAAEAKLKAARLAAEDKRKTDLAALQKTQDDAQKAVEAAKAQAAAAEKQLADLRIEQGQLKAAREVAQQAVAASKKIAAEKKTANAPDLAAAEQDVTTKTAVSDEAGKKLDGQPAKLTAAEAALQKARTELPKTAAGAEKSIAEARKQVEALSQTPVGTAVDQPRSAALRQKLDGLNAELERRRGARAKTKEGTPEYKKADEAAQAIKPEIAKTERELAAAQKPVSIFADIEQEVAKLKTTLEQTTAQVATAKVEIERWKVGQVLQSAHNARRTLTEKQAQYDQFVQAVKDAPLVVEKARNDLAVAQKSVAEGPAKTQEKEASLAKAQQAVDAAKEALTAAEAAVPLKEGAIKAAIEAAPTVGNVADLTTKLEERNAELLKLRDARTPFTAGTPEYLDANNKMTAKRAEITQAQAALTAASAKNLEAPAVKAAQAEATKASEALDKARRETKAAAAGAVAAGKALADFKKEIEAAAQLVTKLQKDMPEIVRNSEVQKAQAEQAVVAAAKELETAKADAEKRRADYETLKAGGTKAASLAVPPSKS